jgi:hypothetical protein
LCGGEARESVVNGSALAYGAAVFFSLILSP